MTFSFTAADHRYRLDGVPVVSVTQILDLAGLVDKTHFTEAHSQRGTEIHRLTADYDLGALEDSAGPYAGYLQAHIKAMTVLAPVWDAVEVAYVHPVYRFGGRPDRVGRLHGAMTVLDIKTGPPAPYHALQTALQAILVADSLSLPATEIHRYGEYLSRTGAFRMERFTDRRDFDRAYALLRRFAK